MSAFGIFAAIAEAEESPYFYDENYTVSIHIKVTNDADGWNSANLSLYGKINNARFDEEFLVVDKEDIKSKVDNGDDDNTLTYDFGRKFPSKVVIYTDFGGGATWREWGADVTIYINGVNVKAQHITSTSGMFSSSDETITLKIDKTDYPYPKTINVLNHHPQMDQLPDEDNFFEFYEDDSIENEDGTIETGVVKGNIFVNACDRFGTVWYGRGSGQADSVTNDSGDSSSWLTSVSYHGYYSLGAIYSISSNSGVDHESTYTFRYDTGNSSYPAVYKKVKVNFYFKHDLNVIVGEDTVISCRGFTGDFVDLDSLEIPDGYYISNFSHTGDGILDYSAEDDSYQFTFGETDATLVAALKPNKYKIAFDPNFDISTGSGSMSQKTATYDSPYRLPANGFSRPGYKFTGWNTESDGTGTAIANRGFAVNLTAEKDATVTLYAQWALNTYDLTLVYPEEMGLENRVVSIVYGSSFEPEAIIDIGDDEKHYEYVESDVDLSRITKKTTAHLTYAASPHVFGDTIVVSPPSCEDDGESYCICKDCGYNNSFTVPALTHNYFVKWVWSEDYSSAYLESICTNCGEVQRVTANVTYDDDADIRTFTAVADFNGEQYSAQTNQHIYTVNYKLNGGAGSIPSVILFEGKSITLPEIDSASVKPLCSFTGWLLGDKLYQPGDTVEAGNMTFVAQWDMKWSNIQAAINNGAHLITLPNDVIAQENDGPLTVPTGRSVTINLNGHKLDRNLDQAKEDGCVFKIAGGNLYIEDSQKTGMITGGYNSGPGGGIYVESGMLYIAPGPHVSYNISLTDGGGIYSEGGKVYIRQAEISENLCSDKGGGICVTGQTTALDMDNATVIHNGTLSSTEKSGGIYSDTGDFYVSNSVVVYENYDTEQSDANVVIDTESVIMTLSDNLGSDALIGIDGEPGNVYAQPDPDDSSISVDTANFRSDNNDYMPALDSAGKLIFTDNVYAQQYSITFRYGEVNDNAVYKTITEYYGTAVEEVDDPEFEGYTFLGWDSQIPETIPVQDTTITALWETNEYKITYKLDGQEYPDAENAVDTVVYGSPVTVRAKAVKEGHTVSDWTFTPALEDGKMPAGDVVANATSTVNTYTVTWIVNGQSTVDSYAFGAEIVIPEDPSIAGKRFKGWSGEIPAAMPAENLEFIASFDAITHTAVFVVPDEDGSYTDETGTYEVVKTVIFEEGQTTLAEPAVPERDGYTGEWEDYTIGTKDIVVKAVYTVNDTPGTEPASEFKLPADLKAKSAAYKTFVTVSVTLYNVPADAKVYIDGKEATVNGNVYSAFIGQVTSARAVNLEVKQGSAVIDSATLKIEVNTNFFGKLFSFISNFLLNLFKWRRITIVF